MCPEGTGAYLYSLFTNPSTGEDAGTEQFLPTRDFVERSLHNLNDCAGQLGNGTSGNNRNGLLGNIQQYCYDINNSTIILSPWFAEMPNPADADDYLVAVRLSLHVFIVRIAIHS